MPAGNPLKACSTECGVLEYLHRAVNELAVNLQSIGLQVGLWQPVLDMLVSMFTLHNSMPYLLQHGGLTICLVGDLGREADPDCGWQAYSSTATASTTTLPGAT